jgi:hypothetical protein
MTNKQNILQELNELKSTLANVTPQNVYMVPVGYFEGLIAQVLSRIKAIEAKNSVEEMSYLSSSLSNISKQIPYSVPAGYFDGLAENMMQLVRESNDYQTAKEELEILSPLLSGLKKEMPYSVPQGYFDNLRKETTTRETKVISITHSRWFRYAAAAVVTGVIVLTGLTFMNTRKAIDPVAQPDKWVKNSIKKVDKADIDAFVKLADEELNNQSDIAANPVKPEEIKDLMKDVSDKEIQDFLDKTPDTETNDDTMTN